ncbi:MAG: hypothetical protein EXX96DRAFT_59816 [Benjaminiella poitrasii]|nr:MAG: hypothetical protein EXX96DRAFT_59816 [Benjaminiella poitrasii]
MPREKKQVHMLSKKSNVIYENWKVYSRHHKLMFRCNEKKAQWYLKRELATPLEDESKAIKLTFQAKGDGHKEGDYMIEDRSNVCVACGSTEQLTMHHVVPEMYRHWMPLVIKSKSSRDLLLLCKHCHDEYEQKAIKLKKECVNRFDIPLEGKGWIYLPEHKKAKKAASALIRSSDKIPKERQEVLKKIVSDFWNEYYHDNKEEDWNAILQICGSLVDHYKGPDYIEHGQSAIEQLTAKCVITEEKETWPDLEAFIKEWRQHFLDHLKPTHLSSSWNVDSDIYSH